MKLPRYPSEIALIAANTVPLAGVLLWDWSVFEILILFWAENVIIGLLNIVKMLAYCVRHRAIGGIFLIPFFTFHYGMFTTVHGLFVAVLFGPAGVMSGNLKQGQQLEPQQFILDTLMAPGVYYGIAALLCSHLISFWLNFLRGGEIDRTDAGKLMAAPYGRVMMQHVTILLGGMLALASGQAVWAHRRERRKMAAPSTP